MDKVEQYLNDYKAGRIAQGLPIGVTELDEAIRYKQGQFNIINGIDNVGKTGFMLWYFLCLAVKHNKTFIIWSGENKAGQLVRQLIEMYSGEKVKDMEDNKLYQYKTEIENWFTFIDNDKMYTNKDLYKIFIDSGRDCALIDPYTGMNRGFTHKDNYDFLNETREFVNTTGMSIYVNTHPNTAGATMIYSAGDYAGYPMPPGKAQSEGGQPFANRVDDFITIHRLVGHPQYNFTTQIFVRKIKDTETGGKVTPIDAPIEFDYNNGLGFTCNKFNPLKGRIEITQPIFNPIVGDVDDFVNEKPY